MSRDVQLVKQEVQASKLVMSYVAAGCGKGQEVNKVKEQLLQSNPVLEGEWSIMHPIPSKAAFNIPLFFGYI